MAPSHCLATCGVFFLPEIDSSPAKQYTSDCCRQILAADIPNWQNMLESFKNEQPPLLSNIGVLADLYYLPLRITKLLGWLGLSILSQVLMPDTYDGQDQLRFSLATSLVDRFADSIVAVSDEQASSLYVFLQACILKGQRELAKRVLMLYFASFAAKRGNVTRVGCDGLQALRYIRSLGPDEHRPYDWRPANPSMLLPVLLLFGSKLGMGSNWDLRALDRLYSGFFLPANYREFGQNVIEEGMNHTHQLGFGIWSIADFMKEFGRITIGGSTSDTRNFSKEGTALCTIASLLFPDRLPLSLECVILE